MYARLQAMDMGRCELAPGERTMPPKIIFKPPGGARHTCSPLVPTLLPQLPARRSCPYTFKTASVLYPCQCNQGDVCDKDMTRAPTANFKRDSAQVTDLTSSFATTQRRQPLPKETVDF